MVLRFIFSTASDLQGCPNILVRSTVSKSWGTALIGERGTIIAMDIVTWWHV